MPLQIIRQDITKMQVDAIVNPTNKYLLPNGGGADAAIHHAAGPDLYAECRKIGRCSIGEAKVTSAYNLNAKIIIHTVGPIWYGGIFNEKKQLQSCYRNCFNEAKRYGCESIAVPLISSGTYRYPKDKVLKIAMSEISEFLLYNDMMIYLVVYDRQSYELSEKLTANIKKFIDDSYVLQHKVPRCAETQLNTPPTDSIKHEKSLALDTENKNPSTEYSKSPCMPHPAPEYSRCIPAQKPIYNETITNDISEPTSNEGYTYNSIDFEDFLKLDDSFSLTLLKLIDEKHMNEIYCYKKANVSKQTWYKIMNDKNYKPNKKTVISFAIALGLTLDETQTLLCSVGFILTKSSLFDVIIMYCITNKIYDIFEIDSILFKYDQETLFSKM